MEIHAPEEPIFTWKQFLIHIGTVTLGILIALSLEGLLERSHHQHMIREARENIRSEIEDNLKEMKAHLVGAELNRKEAERVLQWLQEMQTKHKSSVNEFHLGFNRADLTNTSWTTAQAVGALSLMDYGEVKRAAAVYELQEEYQTLQRRMEDSAIAALTIFYANVDPRTMPAADLEEEKRRVENTLATWKVQADIGVELQKRYRTWLERK